MTTKTTTKDLLQQALQNIDEAIWEVPDRPDGGARLVYGRGLTLEQAKLTMAHYSARLDRLQKGLKPFAKALASVIADSPDDEGDE